MLYNHNCLHIIFQQEIMKSMFIIEEIRFLHKNDKVYIFKNDKVYIFKKIF